MRYVSEHTIVPDPAFYEKVVRGVNGALEICGELQVFGAENIPDTDRTIFVAPHRVPFDPATIGTLLLDAGSAAVPFIGTETIWNWPLIRSGADRMGTIPILRGQINPEKTYLRTEHALTYGTKSLVVFPEGGLVHGIKIKRVLAGVPIIAAIGGAKVCPIAIAGMDYLDFGNITAVIGEPLYVDKRDIAIPTNKRSFRDGAKLTQDLRERIKDMLQKTLDDAEDIRVNRPKMNRKQRAISSVYKTVYKQFSS